MINRVIVPPSNDGKQSYSGFSRKPWMGVDELVEFDSFHFCIDVKNEYVFNVYLKLKIKKTGKIVVFPYSIPYKYIYDGIKKFLEDSNDAE